MSSDRAPPERPDASPEAQHDDIDAERDNTGGLSGITTTPGARVTSNTEMLAIEAELVADGKHLDNPAIPKTIDTGEALAERLDDEVVPAWTRPWMDVSRETTSVAVLLTEALIASSGEPVANPATAATEALGRRFREVLDEHDDDLVPAWTRPWETEDR